MTVYAHAGDIITCENGHEIAEFVLDVKYAAPFDPSAIGKWRQTPLKIGDKPRCERCGAPFEHRGVYHIGRGWRVMVPEPSEPAPTKSWRRRIWDFLLALRGPGTRA